MVTFNIELLESVLEDCFKIILSVNNNIIIIVVFILHKIKIHILCYVGSNNFIKYIIKTMRKIK